MQLLVTVFVFGFINKTYITSLTPVNVKLIELNICTMQSKQDKQYIDNIITHIVIVFRYIPIEQSVLKLNFVTN